MHYEGLLQQLQSDAAAEIPSQPPISLLPGSPLAHQDGGTGARLVALQLLVLPDLLQQPLKQNAKGSLNQELGWGRMGPLLLTAPAHCALQSRAAGVQHALLW